MIRLCRGPTDGQGSGAQTRGKEMRDEPRTDRRPRKRGATRLPGLGALGEEMRVGGPRGGPGTHIRLSIKFISIRAKHEYVRSGWGSLDVFVSNMPKIHHIMANNKNMHLHAETNTARQLYVCNFDRRHCYKIPSPWGTP